MTAVAIDGPAGAGKSSVARAVASSLGFRYLDTGAMYRALALAALDRRVDLDDEVAVGALVSDLEIEVRDEMVVLDGDDVSGRLRGKEVTAGAARVARHPAVRRALVALQRRLAGTGDVVMEGRDIGSEVLPSAEVKIFLTASLDERALRRCKQEGLGDDAATLAQIRAEIARRDEGDRTRDISPLMRAGDAIELDTTGLSPGQVVEQITEIVRISMHRAQP